MKPLLVLDADRLSPAEILGLKVAGFDIAGHDTAAALEAYRLGVAYRVLDAEDLPDGTRLIRSIEVENVSLLKDQEDAPCPTPPRP